jgi:glyoxylase-like metal-dependent hydrolase (beta-lactamase superfamily II)
MINIHCFTCGTVGVDPAVPDRSISRSPIAYTGLFRNPKDRIYLPVKAFYVEYDSHKILIDTGWDSAVRNHPVEAITFPMWVASKPSLPEGQAVDEQLRALGVMPKDLDMVLMTHMDIDHDSGLRLVKDAKHLYVSEEEYRAIHSRQVRYVKQPWYNLPLELMPMQKDESAPYQASWDIYQDGAIKVLLMPGHSEGSVVIRVSNGSRFALIVGDTGYNRSSWEQLKALGPVYHMEDMKTSLQWVQQQRQDPDCVAVLAAHDAEEQRTLITL